MRMMVMRGGEGEGDDVRERIIGRKGCREGIVSRDRDRDRRRMNGMEWNGMHDVEQA